MLIPNATANRLSKIAARLESAHDGEIVAAARMLVKQLGGHGLRIADVIERGVSGGNVGYRVPHPNMGAAPSPPFATHVPKIDALLHDAIFVSQYATPKTLRSLLKMREARHIDPVEMSWIDGLLQKVRDLRAGRAA
ncbi:hypothetical protein [Sphingobium yanoikuyae]|uniref:hypothetical protein n=1 Tax=Sphingobium yanoikuyae TaxID=13690 RepID=UPI0028AD0475|nr:hypothetical protein [Sphingobium yanoikuyae]